MSDFNPFEENKEILVPELIDNYLRDKVYGYVTLTELCHHFCVSRSSLCRKWKEHSDMGIIEYFLYLKMKEAMRLLEEDTKSITQIADLLGYSSIHHFSCSFKKNTGLSPSEYRSSAKS